MTEVEFNYNGIATTIQCNRNDKMIDICQKFESKSQLKEKTIFYLYGGKEIKINNTITFDELANTNDKERNKMNILVVEMNCSFIQNKEDVLVKSKYIICPECKEKAMIIINNNKFTIFGCKNNHIQKDIFFKEFEKTQYIDESKIRCHQCNINNKSYCYENKFYVCNTCNSNLCPLCKSKHNKNHNNIVDYELKEYICKNHSEKYISYCNKCKINLCFMCKNTHKEHEIIYYSQEIIEKEDLKNSIIDLKEKIDETNNIIKKMINLCYEIMDNFNNYYKVVNDIVNNYDIKNRNLETIFNIKEIYESENVRENLDEIIYSKDFHEAVEKILKVYNLINLKQNTIIYEYNELDIELFNDNIGKNKIKLFGKKFVENNKNICRIEYNGKEYDIQETIDIKNIKEKNKFEIKLKGIENVIDMSEMFSNCVSLKYLPDISQWDTSKVTNMNKMFYNCFSLKSFPDISQWDTTKVTDMNNMFSSCSSLKYLPDISQWNMSKVERINGMFCNCSSLEYLPDISQWNTSNIKNMFGLFYKCSSLKYLPDISKWNISNVNNINDMFCDCSSLKYLPDLSNWNTSNIVSMNNLFHNCSSLTYLPDISRWNTANVLDMSFMFKSCPLLSYLPDISKWNISNVVSMRYMFCNCELLKSLPDINKWNPYNVENMSFMFSRCKSLKSLPNISLWKTKEINGMYNRMFYGCDNYLKIPLKFTNSNEIDDLNDENYGYDSSDKALLKLETSDLLESL
jgi:surface protein